MAIPPFIAVDATTKQFPDAVRQQQASNLLDPGAPEAKAVAKALSDGLPMNLRRFSTASFPKWLAAVQKVALGTGNAKLLCVGDSTTAGFGATQATSWPAYLAGILADDLPVQPGLSICMNLGVDTQRWSQGGWQTVFGPGSNALYAEPGVSGGDAVFTPGVNVDTIDVWWYKAAGKGTFVVKIDGAAQSPINTSSSTDSGWRKTSYTVTAGTAHTVSLQLPTVNPVSVMGVDAYVASLRSIRVANWGVSGAITDTWAHGPYSLEAISAYAPDLTIVMLGINDANANWSPSDWAANMTAIINEAKKSGDVIVMSVVPSNSSIIAREKQYRAGTPALVAAADGGYVDLLGRIRAYSSTYYADDLHPNAAGYARIARYVASALHAI